MLLVRILMVLGGLCIAYYNYNAVGEGKLFGFYPFDSPQRIGANMVVFGIYWVAGWLIYRGVKPPKKRPIKTP